MTLGEWRFTSPYPVLTVNTPHGVVKFAAGEFITEDPVLAGFLRWHAEKTPQQIAYVEPPDVREPDPEPAVKGWWRRG